MAAIHTLTSRVCVLGLPAALCVLHPVEQPRAVPQQVQLPLQHITTSLTQLQEAAVTPPPRWDGVIQV